MNGARVPYVVGGAFALHWYSGYWREAHDLDLFLPPQVVDRAMGVMETLGFFVYRKHPEWMAQATLRNSQVDLIYGMGNWLTNVDWGYIERARRGLVLSVPTWVMPPEELIYSKAFVASRNRYDAADLNHILLATARDLDWPQVIARFGDHWEVLLSHLVLFRYIYPSHRAAVPDGVLEELLGRLRRTQVEPWTGGKLCRGPLIDGNGGYSIDTEQWGYRDAQQENRIRSSEDPDQGHSAA